jgi:hypothetical protein
MRRFYVLGLFLLSIGAHGQQAKSDPAQVLKLAQATYEQGRLHEVPSLLTSYLEAPKGQVGFTKEQQRDAHKLLTQTYIYLEEPDLADVHMIKLLKADPFFEVNDAVDPAEFIALYKRFRTKPIFRIGAKFGGNITFPSITGNYYVGANSTGNGQHAPGAGFQVGLVFERDIFQQNRFDKNWKQKLTVVGELQYFSRGFTYTNEQLFVSDIDGSALASQEGVVSQQWLDFNPLIQYRLKKGRVFEPFITLGPGVSYKLNVSNQLKTSITPVGRSSNSVSGPDVGLNESYESFVFSVQAGGGVKVRIGSIFILADARYQYALTNTINPDKRSNREAVFDYGFQNNDIRQSNFTVNLGFLWPYFNPKKISNFR